MCDNTMITKFSKIIRTQWKIWISTHESHEKSPFTHRNTPVWSLPEASGAAVQISVLLLRRSAATGRRYRKVISWHMYNEIQKLKSMWSSKFHTARKLQALRKIWRTPCCSGTHYVPLHCLAAWTTCHSQKKLFPQLWGRAGAAAGRTGTGGYGFYHSTLPGRRQNQGLLLLHYVLIAPSTDKISPVT